MSGMAQPGEERRSRAGLPYRSGRPAKAKLLSAASEQISLLSYAVTSGQATHEETLLLANWEEYRLAVSRVNTTSTDIVWPEKP